MSCVVSRGDFPACRKRGPPRQDRRRLTPEQAARIRAAPYGGVRALAREFGISGVAAWKIQHRITYRDLP